MATIEIFGIPQSTYVWVVRMACEEKGLSYEIVAARPHSAEVDAIHPLGKIPVMRHGRIELFESKAIVSYIDKAFGDPILIPPELQLYAEVEQWVSFVNTAVDPCLIRGYVLMRMFPKRQDSKPDTVTLDQLLPKMEELLRILDDALDNRSYLVGGTFTLADINLLPILFHVQRFSEGRELLNATDSLRRYFALHAERPSFKATIPTFPVSP